MSRVMLCGELVVVVVEVLIVANCGGRNRDCGSVVVVAVDWECSCGA